ncbi:MAG TPA: hypothetical protein PLF84_14180, partial [Bryobacteraceae bacterium]|nr:hypothetical protein [Bryobacteraceae bacterium]
MPSIRIPTVLEVVSIGGVEDEAVMREIGDEGVVRQSVLFAGCGGDGSNSGGFGGGGALRAALVGLERYIVTPETSKFRMFVFADMALCPDHSIYALPISSSYHLGVLSSREHLVWAEVAGSTLEDRPRWRNVKCFDPF